VSLQDVSIGNTSLGIASDRVAIDTGTSLIGAPSTAVDAIFAQVPGAIPADDPNRKGYYYVSANTSFSLRVPKQLTSLFSSFPATRPFV